MSFNNRIILTKTEKDKFTAHVYSDGLPNTSKYQVASKAFSYISEIN